MPRQPKNKGHLRPVTLAAFVFLLECIDLNSISRSVLYWTIVLTEFGIEPLAYLFGVIF